MTAIGKTDEMSNLSHLNPTGRFTGRSQAYAKYRPNYPAEAIDYVFARCGLVKGSRLVDIGCGTGISSRLFAARGLDVIGIEPNADMRAAAQSAPVDKAGQRVTYFPGKAEATGLNAESADAVLAAQAFHWFDPELALREFHRLLSPGGWAILMWNERDERDPFTAAYGALIRTAPGATAIENPRHGEAGKPLLASPLFWDGEQVTFPHEQSVHEAGLLGRAFSASYAPSGEDDVRRWSEGLKVLFTEHNRGGKVVIHYETAVYSARRSG